MSSTYESTDGHDWVIALIDKRESNSIPLNQTPRPILLAWAPGSRNGLKKHRKAFHICLDILVVMCNFERGSSMGLDKTFKRQGSFRMGPERIVQH